MFNMQVKSRSRQLFNNVIEASRDVGGGGGGQTPLMPFNVGCGKGRFSLANSHEIRYYVKKSNHFLKG